MKRSSSDFGPADFVSKRARAEEVPSEKSPPPPANFDSSDDDLDISKIVSRQIEKGPESMDSDSSPMPVFINPRKKRSNAWPVRTLADLRDPLKWINGQKVMHKDIDNRPKCQNGITDSELYFLAIFYCRMEETKKLTWSMLLKKLIIHYELQV